MENVRGKNTKRKHLSKNKKKSWRKIDTGDVDKFLEEERLQERTGYELFRMWHWQRHDAYVGDSDL